MTMGHFIEEKDLETPESFMKCFMPEEKYGKIKSFSVSQMVHITDNDMKSYLSVWISPKRDRTSKDGKTFSWCTGDGAQKTDFLSVKSMNDFLKKVADVCRAANIEINFRTEVIGVPQMNDMILRFTGDLLSL
jgi:hypothetical protein